MHYKNKFEALIINIKLLNKWYIKLYRTIQILRDTMHASNTVFCIERRRRFEREKKQNSWHSIPKQNLCNKAPQNSNYQLN